MSANAGFESPSSLSYIIKLMHNTVEKRAWQERISGVSFPSGNTHTTFYMAESFVNITIIKTRPQLQKETYIKRIFENLLSFFGSYEFVTIYCVDYFSTTNGINHTLYHPAIVQISYRYWLTQLWHNLRAALEVLLLRQYNLWTNNLIVELNGSSYLRSIMC